MILGKDWSTIRKLMVMQGAIGGMKAVEDFATGNPVVFQTDLSKPLKKLAINLLPVQEGSGDPSPSNIRPLLPWGEVGTWTGGKNLFDESKYQHLYTEHDYIWEGVPYNCKYIQLSPNTKYTISSQPHETSSTVVLINNRLQPNVMPFFDLRVESQTVTYKTDETGKLYIGSVSSNDADAYNLIKACKIQIELGEQATAYESPSITPHPVNLQANLLDSSKTSVYGSDSAHYGLHVTFNDGVVAVSGTSTSSGANVSFNMLQYADASLSGKGYKVQVFDVVGTPVKNIYGLRFDNELAIAISFDCSSSTEVNTTFKISVSEETLPSFQPYLPPVYGCELDLTTGEVWGTWASVDMGTLNWQTSADRFAVWVKLTPNPETKDGWGVDDPMACCSKYRYGNVRANDGEDKAIGFYNGLLYARDTDYETPESFKTAVSGLLLVYRLATPVLLATLTPQQINAIKGVNTIWSDANGQIEVTFLKRR